MKLMTKELEKALPPISSTDGQGGDAIIHAKFFDPTGSWTWYATEYDPKEKIFFGLVHGWDEELGYFGLDELESVELPFGLGIERDKSWKAKPLREVITNKAYIGE
jgi:hypothetical protein